MTFAKDAALSSLSQEQQSVVGSFLAEAGQLTGVSAIVLGGSHARGAVRTDSDVDLALYYRTPFSVEQLRKIVWLSQPDRLFSHPRAVRFE
jgi:predicted nucleotidyltransferase